jgi:hypothetical protein
LGPEKGDGLATNRLGCAIFLGLIGRRVAIISDARLAGRADQHAISERLLSISGEDTITVDRKYREAWTARLQIRFLILSNELPRLADASGALAGRFIVLVLIHSFYGREDLGLTDRLLTELPGISNWSIAGWQRLSERRHFVQPNSALNAVRQLEYLGSPIARNANWDQVAPLKPTGSFEPGRTGVGELVASIPARGSDLRTLSARRSAGAQNDPAIRRRRSPALLPRLASERNSSLVWHAVERVPTIYRAHVRVYETGSERESL